MNVCKVCDNANRNKVHLAREIMLGYGDVFEYLECLACGCVQIKEVPNDLSRYYPANYYSFEKQQYSWLGRYLRSQRTAYKLYGTNLIGMWMSKIAGDYSPLSYKKGWFSRAGISQKSAILDVGCGSGKLLRRLAQLGFTNLTGVDPFVKEDIQLSNIIIHKKELSDLQCRFDFVMLHHSFEHMADPVNVLKTIKQILNPESYALIRIPVASYAWRKYGVNWVQLDAPRHLYLHTVNSMQVMAKRAGLKIVDIVFDSTNYQFLGSEENIKKQLRKTDNRDALKANIQPFNKRQIREFQRKADDLNVRGEGDQACFYLQNA